MRADPPLGSFGARATAIATLAATRFLLQMAPGIGAHEDPHAARGHTAGEPKPAHRATHVSTHRMLYRMRRIDGARVPGGDKQGMQCFVHCAGSGGTCAPQRSAAPVGEPRALPAYGMRMAVSGAGATRADVRSACRQHDPGRTDGRAVAAGLTDWAERCMDAGVEACAGGATRRPGLHRSIVSVVPTAASNILASMHHVRGARRQKSPPIQLGPR
jgi:hypothetical protein